MSNCEQHQAQLLAYLYELLEASERQALQEHLQQCGGCQTALTHAQRQQKLLAAAAKAEFAAVRFQPPSAEDAHRAAEAPVLAASSARAPWFSWAIAASILVLLSLGIPGSWWTWRYWQDQTVASEQQKRYEELRAEASRLPEQHQQNIVRASNEVQDIQQQIQKLGQQHQEKWRAFQEAAAKRQLNIIVSGPENIQPGAPNVFHVHTQNLGGQVAACQLDARVLDEGKKVVYEEKGVVSTGDCALTLPPTLPLKPGIKLSLEVAAHTPAGPESKVSEELPLAAPVYLTHLTTDKPMYQPGETVHFRSLTLERFSLKPAKEDLRLVYTVTSPNGEEVFHLDGSPNLRDQGNQALLGPDQKPLRGIGAGDFAISADARGGEYVLTVREAHNRFPEQQRKFIVNQYERPRLNKELDLTRKSYGPGEEVVAACKVSRVEAGPAVSNRPVTATVQIDGKSYGADGQENGKPLSLRTDGVGAVKVAFKLPRAIERGQGTLAVQFTDGASYETIVRPIPIVVKKLLVEFFPEGGDLVAGVPNRVYFQVHTMLGKPAEVKGRIVDQAGRTAVESVETLHDDKEPGVNQGVGRFGFTPQAGKKYELKIEAPVGIEGKYELPLPKDDGVALRIPNSVTSAKEPLRVVVHSAQKDRKLVVGAYCRGRLMDHQSVTAKHGDATQVELNPAQSFGGVYRVTVFEDRGTQGDHQQLVPVAERLIYRAPAEQLILTCKPDKKQYIPGDKVKLAFAALNEKEQPAPAVLLVAVVDKSVITMADEKTARTMPTHCYLTTEVRKPEDLEYADFLLSAHPKAAEALDRLLGTQGWRRFAEQDPGKFRQQYKEDADRLLVTIGQSSQRATNFFQAEAEKLQKDYTTQLTELQQRQAKATESLMVAQAGQDLTPKMQALQKQVGEAVMEYQATADRLDNHLALGRFLMAVVPTAVLLLAAVACLVIAGMRQAPTFKLAAAACAALAAVLVFVLPWEQPATEGQFAMKAHEATKDSRELARIQEAREEFLATHALALPAKERLPGAGAFPPQAPPPPAPLAEAPNVAENRPQAEVPRDADMPQGRVENLRFAAAKNGQAEKKVAEKMEPPRDAEVAKLDLLEAHADRLAKVEKEAGKDLRARRELAQNLLGQINGDKKKVPEADKDGAIAQFKRLAPPAVAPVPQKAAAARGGLAKRMPPAAMPQAAGPVAGGGAGFRGGGWEVGAPGLMPENQLMLEASKPMRIVEPPPPPMVVREYAYQHPSFSPTQQRRDYVETVCWQPVLVLPDGKADISFDLCDSVTTFQVTAFGHTLDGRLGAVTSAIESKLPFTLEPKLPIEVTASDKVDIPVSIANNTSERCPVNLHLSAAGLNLVGKGDAQLTVDAESRVRRLFRLEPALVEGQARLNIEGNSQPFRDSVTRAFSVVPNGFPVVNSRSDLLEKVASNEVVLPETWVKGTLTCQVQVYPSTLADLQKGLESLLREPGGCFEQTSTSNYPNVLILDYLKESDQAKPEIMRRAKDLLASGYQKLTSFECQDPSQQKRQGYEWFGGTAPPHEALTAYGLLEFRDMARVYDVDATMVERTRTYLMSRKDGKGGFQRNPRALDSFGRAPDDITNAYIVWALTESGKQDDVDKELAALAAQAKTSKDPYFLSLVATSLINRNQANEGLPLLKTVAAAQKEDGHIDAARTSITGSGGRDLQIETTALAVLGWLKANRPADFNVPLQKAVKWIGQQRGGYGGFGSTQSTILALKALIAFTKANKKTAEGGDLHLYVGDQDAAHLSFPAGAQEALVLNLPEAEKRLKPGKNLVRVDITGKNVFPYTLTWSYRTLKPASADQYPVRLSARLDRETASEGETVHLTVTVENSQDKGQGMAVAIIGLPAGLTLPEDMKQLKEHALLRNNGTEKGLIGAWETRGRELILYWRDLAPKQKIEVPLELICRVPGEYSGPASRAYLYYNSDLKHWIEPLKMTIKAKTE